MKLEGWRTASWHTLEDNVELCNWSSKQLHRFWSKHYIYIYMYVYIYIYIYIIYIYIHIYIFAVGTLGHNLWL